MEPPVNVITSNNFSGTECIYYLHNFRNYTLICTMYMGEQERRNEIERGGGERRRGKREGGRGKREGGRKEREGTYLSSCREEVWMVTAFLKIHHNVYQTDWLSPFSV